MKIDRQLVSKQIATTKLKLKVIIASVILLAAVGTWFVVQYFLPQPSTIDPTLLELAEPFSFQLNEGILEQIADKQQFTEVDLEHFVIYVPDENSLNRGNALEVTELRIDNFRLDMVMPEVENIVIEEDETAFIPEEVNTEILNQEQPIY